MLRKNKERIPIVWECGSCAYFIDEFTHNRGSCHRSPPRVFCHEITATFDRPDDNDSVSLFPCVASYDYCGEWLYNKYEDEEFCMHRPPLHLLAVNNSDGYAEFEETK